MRAVVVESFGGPEVLVVRDLPPPVPDAGEVVVDVHAAGVNFPDLLVVGGTYQILPPLPFSPGKEVAGIVRELGAGVTGLHPGQRVVAQLEHGGYRECVAVPAAQVVPVPDGVDLVEAAASGLVELTAHFALVRRAGLRPGETVLVTGAGGGVGRAAVQIAKALGARVLAAVRPGARAVDDPADDPADHPGADHVLAVEPAQLRDRVRDLTGGRGADVVLESVGGDVFRAALRATAWEGRVVVIGFASGAIPEVKAGHLLVKNVSVLGLQVSDYRDREPAAVREVLEQLLRWHADGTLRTRVAGTHRFEDAARALDAVRVGGTGGRIVLTP
ncbi:MAG TPA: NADPH:quinone oxidoreductase family protein [Pseudonocardia sp.]|nr:NADPH:quinone oxidoreductase family protein [Pseudonocardia sp.]